ncbi:predicted protein [Verticillium alfalfae VaMs.102]|uniref:Predicted protein n=1 Tax=Verticillium alfalfae (strain VaMs.102 / ATCC MYA-4576 / FGSC 10136) TaxID=526221 RepID=C9SLE2_VERA1|nr:predicted protein [Verticillium alfalfae VaMs.102]EEY19510.1 predicted protein [Verticillium alfalfae VaMs.102]
MARLRARPANGPLPLRYAQPMRPPMVSTPATRPSEMGSAGMRAPLPEEPVLASSAVGRGASDEVDAGGGMASGRVVVGAATTRVVGCGGATMSSSSEEVDAEGPARMEESRVVGGRVMAEGRSEGMPVSEVVRDVGRGSSEEAVRPGIEDRRMWAGVIASRSGDVLLVGTEKGRRVGVGTHADRRSLKKSAMMKSGMRVKDFGYNAAVS